MLNNEYIDYVDGSDIFYQYTQKGSDFLVAATGARDNFVKSLKALPGKFVPLLLKEENFIYSPYSINKSKLGYTYEDTGDIAYTLQFHRAWRSINEQQQSASKKTFDANVTKNRMPASAEPVLEEMTDEEKRDYEALVN